MKNLYTFILTIFCAVSTYAAVACYSQLSAYDAKIVALEKIIQNQNKYWDDLKEEDRKIYSHIDEQDARFKNYDNVMRIQNEQIASLRNQWVRKLDKRH